MVRSSVVRAEPPAAAMTSSVVEVQLIDHGHAARGGGLSDAQGLGHLGALEAENQNAAGVRRRRIQAAYLGHGAGQGHGAGRHVHLGHSVQGAEGGEAAGLVLDIDHVAALQADVLAELGRHRRQGGGIGLAAALDRDGQVVGGAGRAAGRRDDVQNPVAVDAQRRATRLAHVAQHIDSVRRIAGDGDQHLGIGDLADQGAADGGRRLGRGQALDPNLAAEGNGHRARAIHRGARQGLIAAGHGRGVAAGRRAGP